jgi:cytochrome c oxidase assembly factor CtaG
VARWRTSAAVSHRARLARAVAACAAGAAGLILLAAGVSLRFHVENTAASAAAEERGALWLLGSTALLAAAAGTSHWSGAPLWATALICFPVLAGVAPALLLPGNILPFGSALVSGLVAVVGLTAVLVSTARR